MTTLSVAPGDRSVLWRDGFPPTWHLKPVKYVCSINQRALPNPGVRVRRHLQVGPVF